MVFWAVVYSIAILLRFNSAVQASTYILFFSCDRPARTPVSRFDRFPPSFSRNYRAGIVRLLRPVQRQHLQEVSRRRREGMVQRFKRQSRRIVERKDHHESLGGADTEARRAMSFGRRGKVNDAPSDFSLITKYIHCNMVEESDLSLFDPRKCSACTRFRCAMGRRAYRCATKIAWPCAISSASTTGR